MTLARSKRCVHCDEVFVLPRKGRSNDHWKWKYNPSRGRGWFTCRHREREREVRDEAKYHERRKAAPIDLATQTKFLRQYLQKTLTSARSRSKKLAREFTITLDDLLALWDEQNGLCAYSAFPMTYQSGCRETNASIERIDSSRCYVVNNVCLVQTRVNVMKMDSTLESLIEMAEAIATRRDIIVDKYIRINAEDADQNDQASFA